MPRPLGDLRVLFSARVLFDLEKADEIFRSKGVEEYIKFMRAKGRYHKAYDPEVGGRRLEKGSLWHFAAALTRLNEQAKEPVVEIGVYCKDDAQSALPIFRNLDLSELSGTEFRLATVGKSLSTEDHAAIDTDLLLTRNPQDAQFAVDHDIAAAVVNIPQKLNYKACQNGPVRLWVDGDAVAFGSSSELSFRENGLVKYKQSEKEDFDKPVEAGPFTKILSKISKLNAKFSNEAAPFEISLLTARGGPACARVFQIAANHDIVFNGRLYFMGGASKLDVLRAHQPEIYFDDQMVHLEKATEFCATGHVPYKTGSPMDEFMRKQQAGAKNSGPDKTGASPAP